jgi:hypothetical protein
MSDYAAGTEEFSYCGSGLSRYLSSTTQLACACFDSAATTPPEGEVWTILTFTSTCSESSSMSY